MSRRILYADGQRTEISVPEDSRPFSPGQRINSLALRLFGIELVSISAVFIKALHLNKGRKYVRIVQEGCHAAWAERTGEQASIACCSLLNEHDPIRWDAAICQAAISPTTGYLTSRWAFLLPCATLILNCLYNWAQGKTLKRVQRNRFVLYAFIISFRTTVLFLALNYVQGILQGLEDDTCWYSHLRHDKRCRERFDFADHGVLFIAQYLAIQTFECVAILRECVSPVHVLICTVPVACVAVSSLLGLYATVSFFHSRLESTLGVLIGLITIQLPLILIAIGRFEHSRIKWLRSSHYFDI